jgi:hypothetical protein
MTNFSESIQEGLLHAINLLKKKKTTPIETVLYHVYRLDLITSKINRMYHPHKTSSHFKLKSRKFMVNLMLTKAI